MGDNDVPEPHPGLAEAERRVRAALEEARLRADQAQLALRHAELGMILAVQHRYAPAVSAYESSLSYIQMLRADGRHEQQRITRLTSLSSPPPSSTDIDLDRLEVEVRVALVEALAGGGNTAAARAELDRARPLTKGLLRRSLRRRLDRVDQLLPAVAGSVPDLPAVRRSVSKATTPEQQRSLRLKLANGYLDSGDFDAAVRESLLLVRDSDAAGDATMRAGARQVLGLGLEGQGRTEEGLSVLSEAFRDLRNHGDSAGMIGMAEALAHRLLMSGDANGAATVLRTAERAAADTGDRGAELSSATMLGVVLDESGDRRGAVSVLNGVVTRAQAYDKPLARADALHSAAVSLGGSGKADDLVEALSLLEEAKRLYLAHDKPERIAGCDHEAAAMLGRARSYDAAAARYTAARDAYVSLPEALRDTGDWPDELADCEANLDWLAGGRSDLDASLFQSGGHSMSHTV